MAAIWTAFGGNQAIGPEDELTAASGTIVTRTSRRVSAFSPAQVAIHGLIGVLTATFVTYTVLLDSDRTVGYLGLIVSVAITVVPGLLMFSKWRSGYRPSGPGIEPSREPRPEDRLPKPLVYLHGLGALTTAVLIVVLLLVD